MMDFKEYESKAVTTAIYAAASSIIYPAIGLANEAGESLGKVKKMIRDGNLDAHGLHAEIGDVLWYCAALCRDLSNEYGIDFSLDRAAKDNLQKLEDRAKRGVLSGSGDNR